MAVIFYLPSEFETELSRLSIMVIEFMIASACISLGYWFDREGNKKRESVRMDSAETLTKSSSEESK